MSDGRIVTAQLPKKRLIAELEMGIPAEPGPGLPILQVQEAQPLKLGCCSGARHHQLPVTPHGEVVLKSHPTGDFLVRIPRTARRQSQAKEV